MSIRIFLVGMPGSGKSYWGRRWADAYGWNFYDLDEEIESREGKAVDEIIKEDGELYFRSLEHAALRSVVEKGITPLILACGGGTPIFHNNLKTMQDAGYVVYLKATVKELVERLAADTKPRPLLLIPTAEAVANLLKLREPIYNKAYFTFEAGHLAENTFDIILETCINEHL